MKLIYCLTLLYSMSTFAVPFVPYVPPKNNAAEAPDINKQVDVPKEKMRQPQPLSTLKQNDPESMEIDKTEFNDRGDMLEINETNTLPEE